MSHTHFTQGIPSPPACKIRSTEVRDRGQTASANTHGSRPATAAQNRGRQRSGPGARAPSPPPSSSLGPRAAGRGEDILSPPSSPEDLGEGGARNSPLPGAAAAKFRGPQAGPGQLLGVSECPIPAGGELALGRGAVSGGCSLPGTQAVPSLPDCKAPDPTLDAQACHCSWSAGAQGATRDLGGNCTCHRHFTVLTSFAFSNRW